MPYPSVERIELPLLQELAATGGAEHVRFLYDRLVAYFPQLGPEEVLAVSNGHRRQWRRLVQAAARGLDDKREIERDRGRWRLTERGRRRVAEEEIQFTFDAPTPVEAAAAEGLSHVEGGDRRRGRPERPRRDHPLPVPDQGTRGGSTAHAAAA